MITLWGQGGKATDTNNRRYLFMKKFAIGDIVGYEKETQEWQIVKIEMVQGKHDEEYIEYTLKKVKGQDLGRKVTTTEESLL